jgi:hypothetical protein
MNTFAIDSTYLAIPFDKELEIDYRRTVQNLIRRLSKMLQGNSDNNVINKAF